jgi:hypothetical protein
VCQVGDLFGLNTGRGSDAARAGLLHTQAARGAAVSWASPADTASLRPDTLVAPGAVPSYLVPLNSYLSIFNYPFQLKKIAIFAVLTNP